MAMAHAGFDFLWIEMQHSPLTFEDVARMIWACRGASAMPFIRVPDATESDIQKATDIGAVERFQHCVRLLGPDDPDYQLHMPGSLS